MKKNTQQLIHQLKTIDTMEAYLTENKDEILQKSTETYLQELLEQKGMKMGEVGELSQQGDYVYKVFQGKRKPSRDTLLAIALALKLTLEETQLLLRIATQAQLDPRSPRDAVLLYGIQKTMSVVQLNHILYDLGMGTL